MGGGGGLRGLRALWDATCRRVSHRCWNVSRVARTPFVRYFSPKRPFCLKYRTEVAPKTLLRPSDAKAASAGLPGQWEIVSGNSVRLTAKHDFAEAAVRAEGKMPPETAIVTSALWQAAVVVSYGNAESWCARLGSNQQPLPSEGSTLSIELRAHMSEWHRVPYTKPWRQNRCESETIPVFGPSVHRKDQAIR